MAHLGGLNIYNSYKQYDLRYSLLYLFNLLLRQKQSPNIYGTVDIRQKRQTDSDKCWKQRSEFIFF